MSSKYVGLAVLILLTIAACERTPSLIWASNVKSPSGEWIAEAKTQQWDGPGNNYVATTINLVWTQRYRRSPIEILELSNESAYPIGNTMVKMEWLSNSHLDLTYGAGATVNFQAVKAAGLEVTAHQFNDKTTTVAK